MRPAWIEVDLNRLVKNLTLIRRHTDNRPVMAVGKANAYGHGLIEAARLYEKLGVEWRGAHKSELSFERELRIVHNVYF